ncbi:MULTISPECIES: Asp-tRNA(Asn)/Glu-tRNA(Gln) amidotransferase subunit GatA [Ectothiorhodospira]|uniref:Glutamyl-tRNA(Gln) amidotransferase subunit A n=1 Tax=Ectothiorhodospira marina TaxID=1396821 RepID=A0A1H7QKZ5_9GAMM|nr:MULTISPECIES: Asp-tRNA(Asn)/Glu-tRNA(Gln) amidotransferase subunit GatA [Ectothiorhodospira]MCG5514797.1 Asp-tRNA(Asn)/Glu-tRNA(Gln) amidotransferase subunit GatA [Ectothiorhodospira sp. 9100]MCG5518965.1 Asp-tRNA(Asn)/Glu-tRNA(Gln) amidotransferase subunit GatA [Ectothiorhodospira sp. 9905]SEL48275.1 aspartyl/glutamyl-tRNA(Asn/Gln) amidotransferase subunit A [Ectothiorhodospira marina]
MHEKSIAELAAALKEGEVSSVELTAHYLRRIETLDDALNAYVTVTGEQAMEAARAADEARAQGHAGPLTGVPIAHKDIFCTEGTRTSCGSKMLDNFIAPYDATVVARFKAAGCPILGKTNMDEFAMGSSNETSYYGPVKNPWDTERVPGGSSGGSAAVVAGRLAPGATGTDTGGSIRQPAALNGVTGIKPTYGRVSRWGMIAFASSLDQGGPMARTAEDCALMLNVMAGFDHRDSTSIQRPDEDFTRHMNTPVKGLRIGLPKQFFGEGMDAGVARVVDEAIAHYKGLGAEFVEVDLPHSDLSVAAYYVVAPAECSSNLARFDGVRYGYRCEDPKDLLDLYMRSRGEGFGPEVKRRIMVGTYALSAGYFDAYYLKAQKIRRLIAEDFASAFKEVDVILGPTAPSTAFRLGEKTNDPVTMYLSDIYTIAVNLAGLPALSLPAGFSDGLPVGLQLIGNYFDEARLLGVAHQYQVGTEWCGMAPGGFV